MKNVKALAVIDSETLMNSEFRERRFCVETLLPQGLCIAAVYERALFIMTDEGTSAQRFLLLFGQG